MGLIVKSKGDKKVTVAGSPIELTNGAYVRVEYGVRPDGRSVQAVLYTYFDKQSFKDGKLLNTSITGATFEDKLGEGVVPDLGEIMNFAKVKLEEAGYEVLITDLD